MPVISGLCWFVLFYGAVGVLFSPERAIAVTAWPSHVQFEIPAAWAALAVMVAFLSYLYAAGFLLAAAGVVRPPPRTIALDPLALAVLGVVALGGAAAIHRPDALLPSAIAVALASAAVLVVWLLARLLWRGETIEIESRWGGLGGGLGGVRLSPAASLALLAFVLVLACVAAMLPSAAPASGPAAPSLPAVDGGAPTKAGAADHTGGRP